MVLRLITVIISSSGTLLKSTSREVTAKKILSNILKCFLFDHWNELTSQMAKNCANDIRIVNKGVHHSARYMINIGSKLSFLTRTHKKS